MERTLALQTSCGMSDYLSIFDSKKRLKDARLSTTQGVHESILRVDKMASALELAPTPGSGSGLVTAMHDDQPIT